MHDIEEFDRVVSAIHDAALQPELWPVALQAVADSLACDVFHSVWDRAEQRPTQTWASASASAIAHDHYNRCYGRIDPPPRAAASGAR